MASISAWLRLTGHTCSGLRPSPWGTSWPGARPGPATWTWWGGHWRSLWWYLASPPSDLRPPRPWGRGSGPTRHVTPASPGCHPPEVKMTISRGQPVCYTWAKVTKGSLRLVTIRLEESVILTQAHCLFLTWCSQTKVKSDSHGHTRHKVHSFQSSKWREIGVKK